MQLYNCSMYELYPYFTNDSTVGLFSRQDDDIYHSTYGALTESWQKFIIPSGLEQYLQTHESVRILDICYGIGYNTKTSLNVFIKNFLKQENIFKNKNKKLKKPRYLHQGIAAVGTDNARQKRVVDSNGKFFHAYSQIQLPCIAEIDADNINGGQFNKLYENFGSPYRINTKNKSNCTGKNENSFCNNILIDAVDLDKTLIYLSPFIADASKFNFLFKKNYEISLLNEFKYNQIKNIKNFRRFIKKDFRLKKEVSIILFKKLLGSNPEFFNDAILQTILNHKKYLPFLSKFMVNFAKFYLNLRSYNKEKKKKPPFLHNIYYRYISRSSKIAAKLLKNCKIDINVYKDDARHFIQAKNTTYNFIYLDAFTPAKCPALWTVQFFRELYYKLEDDGMILTYSNSAAVRNAFLQNGFAVGKVYDEKLQKFVGTVAAKNGHLIQYKLDECDLDLINSKAGICFNDESLNLDNNTIIENRKLEVKESNLRSSSQVLKHR